MEATFHLRLGALRGGFPSRAWFVAREGLGAVLGGLGMRATAAWRGGLADLRRDLFHALRALTRNPSLTLHAVAALALGIALPTILFCFVYGALRPLPVPEGGRVVHLEHARPAQGLDELDVSVHDYEDWRAAQSGLEDLAAMPRESKSFLPQMPRETVERNAAGWNAVAQPCSPQTSSVNMTARQCFCQLFIRITSEQ